MLLQHNINFTISLSYNLCKLLFMILTSLTFYFFYKQKKKNSTSSVELGNCKLYETQLSNCLTTNVIY